MKLLIHRMEIIDQISPLSNNSADNDVEFAYRIIDMMDEKYNPEEIWKKFINHLNEVDSIGKDQEGKYKEHKTFLGSIEKYKKIFIESQT